MDGPILFLAMPSINEAIQPTTDQSLWILDIYGFAVGSLLITFGNLGDRFGRKKLLLVGATVFGIGSLCGAFSPTPELLIASRALMGLGGATLLPSCLAVISELFENPAQRARAIGIFAATFAAGFVIGPIVGGVLLNHFWWGSVFLMNIPVIVLFLCLAPILINATRRESAADTRRAIDALPAQQQPTWRDDEARVEAISSLKRSAPLVSESEIAELKDRLRTVGNGSAFVLQAGDCAEPMTDTASDLVENKARSLDAMSQMLERRTHSPVVRVGRIAGQFAKPRSRSHETAGGALISTYRGALVNDPYPSARAREHEPQRLVRARAAAEVITQRLRHRGGERIWTSHEALVLDYELPQIRPTSDGRAMLGSAHTIWIGARTSQLDHAHVALAASIINPVGCKVSANTTPEELVSLADTINPDRETGRLMLIARMGTSAERLPELMGAVKRAGHPAIWLCDPMHGNTLTAADGRKARYLEAITSELMEFQRAARATGVIAGGVHLETTIDNVKECLINAQDVREGHHPYTSLCDPRLTIRQAVDVLSHWEIGA